MPNLEYGDKLFTQLVIKIFNRISSFVAKLAISSEGGGSGERAFPPFQNLNSRDIVSTNGDNVSNHKATKQDLYCSHRKPCKAFQCDLSYFD